MYVQRGISKELMVKLTIRIYTCAYGIEPSSCYQFSKKCAMENFNHMKKLESTTMCPILGIHHDTQPECGTLSINILVCSLISLNCIIMKQCEVFSHCNYEYLIEYVSLKIHIFIINSYYTIMIHLNVTILDVTKYSYFSISI